MYVPEFTTLHFIQLTYMQEPKNEYSRLDPKPAESARAEDSPSAEDEELLRALLQTEEIGELEATDLMQFAYQIASGMVCTNVYYMSLLECIICDGIKSFDHEQSSNLEHKISMELRTYIIHNYKILLI